MPKNPNNNTDPSGNGASDPTGRESPPRWELNEPVENRNPDQWEKVGQAHFDREGAEELGTAIVFAVAEAKGVDPMDRNAFTPLYESIDAPAVEESFFGVSGAATRQEESGTMTFLYNDYKVALRTDGWIFVYEAH